MSNIFIYVLLEEERRNSERFGMRVLRRRMRDTQNPFEVLSKAHFIDLYRFPKHICQELIGKVAPLLRRSSRAHAIPLHLKVLAALSFFASGSYQRCVGQDVLLTLSQTTVSRCVKEVAEAINTIADQYIKFPSNDEMVRLKRMFFEVSSFPGVIGLIDGTHIKITCPVKEIEHVYYCRKGGHSKNVQIVCDSNFKILNINARFGGSTHDAYIWRRSILKRHLEQKYEAGERNFWLLGDSGYPLQPWLMTPILTPTSEVENNYNISHKKTRCIVERCIGVLKGRFRCLLKDRVLHYTPEKAGKIINACAVLHNILVEARVPPPENAEIEENEAETMNSNATVSNTLLSEGRRIQRSLAEQHFRFN